MRWGSKLVHGSDIAVLFIASYAKEQCIKLSLRAWDVPAKHILSEAWVLLNWTEAVRLAAAI